MIKSIDTSDTYGNGLSEKYIGNILRTIPRQELKIYTKAGTTFITESNGLYTKKNLIRKINESLKRLNTDYIDIYQLHNFDNYTPPNEIFETLEQLKLEGKILNYGVSNYNELGLNKYVLINLVFEVLINFFHYNLVNRHNLNLSKFSKLIVYGALARGLFRDNPEDSFRVFKSKKINDDKNSDIFKSIFASLYSFAKDHNLSITDIAINFTLSNKKISKVIFGIRTIEQLKLIYDSIKLNSNKKLIIKN